MGIGDECQGITFPSQGNITLIYPSTNKVLCRTSSAILSTASNQTPTLQSPSSVERMIDPSSEIGSFLIVRSQSNHSF